MEMEEHMSKENVLVYGMGNFYLQNEKTPYSSGIFNSWIYIT